MPVEIIPFLFLGEYKDAENVSLNTKLIINCTKNIPFFSYDSTNIRIPIDDTPDDSDVLLNVWKETDLFDNIKNHIIQSHDVLVHCQMGRQRSAATIVAFLIKTLRLSKTDAILLIKSKKKEAFFPEVTFDEILTSFENTIHMQSI
jgi:hypothetical protein